jgi:hypothetical protein
MCCHQHHLLDRFYRQYHSFCEQVLVKHMSKYKTIPAGYRLSVTSWENDADNYHTEVKEGLTKEQTTALVGFIKLFKSEDDVAIGFGNLLADHDDQEYEVAMTEIRKYLKPNLKSLTEVLNFRLDNFSVDDDEAYNNLIYELHGELFGSSEYFLFRVLDSYDVQYVPLTVELPDVTHEFP